MKPDSKGGLKKGHVASQRLPRLLDNNVKNWAYLFGVGVMPAILRSIVQDAVQSNVDLRYLSALDSDTLRASTRGAKKQL